MKKVLVLEDESSIRSFIVINLRRAGYEVVEAETGEEALEKLKEHGWSRAVFRDLTGTAADNDRRLEQEMERWEELSLQAEEQEER